MTSTRTGLVSSASFVASYVRRISHRFLRYFCRLSTLCTCQLRLASVFQLCAGVGGGWGGVMTSMRMRIVSSVSFVALFLKRCRLLCEALVAASCCFTFETSTMQKPQAFEAFQTKTSQRTPKIIKNKRRKAWCLRQFRRKATKKPRPTTVLLTKTTQNLGFSNFGPKNLPKINDTPRAGGIRTCYLVVVVVVVDVVAATVAVPTRPGLPTLEARNRLPSRTVRVVRLIEPYCGCLCRTPLCQVPIPGPRS